MRILRETAVTLADLLTDEVMAQLEAAGSIRAYSNGQIIQQRGDNWVGLSIVKSGQVAAGNHGDDGSFLASALLRAGECYGEVTLFLNSPRTHSLWAQGAAQVIHIDGPHFLALFESEPGISRALLTLTMMRNQELLEQMDIQRRLSVVAQVARLLLSAADASQTQDVIVCRQEDLAIMLGVSRVAIGKALKKLESDHLVYVGYGRIRIPDVCRLLERVRSDDPLYSLRC